MNEFAHANVISDLETGLVAAAAALGCVAILIVAERLGWLGWIDRLEARITRWLERGDGR